MMQALNPLSERWFITKRLPGRSGLPTNLFIQNSRERKKVPERTCREATGIG
jgi:hypothetical protein